MKINLEISLRIAFAFVALSSICAGLWILLTPLTIQEVSAVSPGESPAEGEITTQQISWYKAQGVWGVIILVIFSGFFVGSATFGIRGRLLPTAITTAVSLVLTYLAGFSIGMFYLPAAAASVVGIGLLVISKRSERT
jgi:hypothetical protein